MKNHRLSTIILLILLFGIPLTVKSQITIGSEAEPIEGSILDLKEDDKKGVNSTKGLMLPRMSLSEKDKLYPMLPKGYDSERQEPIHSGLIVYNISPCFEKGAGPYAWDGEAWTYLAQPKFEVYEYADQEGNPFLARRFGDAGIWMVQNLAATTYDKVRDSDDKSIRTLKAGDIAYPDNKPQLTKDYPWMGVFYNLQTALNYETNKGLIANTGRVQGMCPNGWHVPKPAEWIELEHELLNNTPSYTTATGNFIDDPTFDHRETVVNKVKQGDTPSTSLGENELYGKNFIMPAFISPCVVPNTTNTDIGGVSLNTEQGGFGIRLVGAVDDKNQVDGYGEKAGFWLSYSSNDQMVNGRNRVLIKFSADKTKIGIHNNSGGGARHYSIRCKKNDDTP